MKTALALCILLFFGLARANDALILISPERAGPVVDERTYVKGEWLLWPAPDRADGANRILSLLTGMDWDGTGGGLVFGLRDGKYLSAALRPLGIMGYFRARERVVGSPTIAVATFDNKPSPISLFLALDGRSPQVAWFLVSQEWPKNALVVAEADNWDQVAAITRTAGGKVLVAEYPPPPGQNWSRYWMRGSGWPSRLPVWRSWNVPGLIPASQAGNLVRHSASFSWVENDVNNWGGANRWLAFMAYTSPLTLAILGFLAAFFVGCTVYLVSIEEHAKFGSTAVKYLTLLPATILLAGVVTRAFGTSAVSVWIIGSFALLVVAAQLLGGLLGKLLPNSHPMLAICVVGFATSACCPPLWGMYSNVFSATPLSISPEAAASFFGYLVGLCAFSRGSPGAKWLTGGVAILAFAWGIGLNPWWVGGEWPFAVLPLIAVLVSTRLYRVWMLPVFALLPLADGKLIVHGISWSPGDLYSNFAQFGGINLARHAEFFTSYGFVGCGLAAGAMAIFVERYFFHEIRRTLIRDSRTRALFQASFVCAAMGILQPLMLYVALMSFVGGTCVLLVDTARSI